MKPDKVFDVFKCFACNDFGTKLAADFKDTHIAAGPDTQANRVTFADPQSSLPVTDLETERSTPSLTAGPTPQPAPMLSDVEVEVPPFSKSLSCCTTVLIVSSLMAIINRRIQNDFEIAHKGLGMRAVQIRNDLGVEDPL